MSDRSGQTWRMGEEGTGILFLVTGPPQTAREVLLEADSPIARDRRRRSLDRMLYHPVLYLETGHVAGVTEDYPGRWEKVRTWKRIA